MRDVVDPCVGLRVACRESDRIEDVRDDVRGGGDGERLNGSSSATEYEKFD